MNKVKILSLQIKIKKDYVKLFYKCLKCGTLYKTVFQKAPKYCRNCGGTEFLLLKFNVPRLIKPKKEINYHTSDSEKIETVKENTRGIFELNFEAIAKGAPLIVSPHPGVYEIKLDYELEKIRGRSFKY